MINNSNTDFLDEKINKYLINRKFNPSYCGFTYIREAIKIVKLSDKPLFVTKDIYPKIAKKYGTKIQRIERGIRHIIGMSSMYDNTNFECICKIALEI